MADDGNTLSHRHQLLIELLDPVIRVSGTLAWAAYTLHLTELDDTGETIHVENVTRIFEKQDNQWKMVHFHRS